MKLLIIGGTGVLSGAVAREAIKQGIDVYILHRGTKPHLIPKGVKSLIADARDAHRVVTVLDGMIFDSLIDFICYNKPQLIHSYQLFHKYTRQYIFISTACVYDTSLPGMKSEDAPKVLKSWLYSKEKWECEKYLMNESKKSGIPYTIIRPAVTYDDTRIPYGITPVYGYHWTLIGRALSNKPIITWDGGKARWNLMRVEDFAIGVVATVGNSKAYNNAFNVSGDDAYSWQDVLDALAKAINHPVKTIDISSQEYKRLYSSRSGEISGRAHDSIIDNSKIKQLAPSFQTHISLEEGVMMVVEGYKKNNYYKGIDYRFDAEMDVACKKSGYNSCSFVDYLGSATLFNKIEYYYVINKGNKIGKVLKLLMKIFKKLHYE